MKHTPEPWEWNTHGIQPATNFKQVRFDDYQRAKSCVNACAGMDDPAAEIQRLRAIESDIDVALHWVKISLLEDILKEISGKKPEQHIEVIEERIQYLKENNP
jgi:hypothetical protein